ncbi:MAG: hypothetical protein DRQ55_12440 [Planctomycetota bacterium]|nr:MAG: hypothetical protein DRQ55_12440 [Planctomycetota bacterium]
MVASTDGFSDGVLPTSGRERGSQREPPRGPETELHVASLRFRLELAEQLDQVRRSDKALKTVLRLALRLFSAQAGCVAVTPPGAAVATRFLAPRGVQFDQQRLELLTDPRRPKLPPDLMTGGLQRRGRVWGHLVLRRAAPFTLAERRELASAAVFASRQLRRIDDARAAEVRARIDRKILEQLRPNDLFYQVLHGLRSLTRYDHSAAVFIFDAGAGALRLAAEQIAWRKARSGRIGARRSLDDEALSVLEAGAVHLLRRDADGRWCARSDAPGGCVLAALLQGSRDTALEDTHQHAGSVLLAPLVARDRLLGLLQVASCQPQALDAWEAGLVHGFLPQVAVAVANLERTESLEQGMLQAERKHVMADLARGVSHDVNNAMGAVLPLVQQMSADLRAGRLEPDVLLDDLSQVEASVHVCRRIFSGMLALGQGQRGQLGHAEVGRAARSALAVLEEGLRRQGVKLKLDLPDALPSVRGSLGELEQVVLNLTVNARDAMPSGGTLSVSARAAQGHVVLTLRDTGRGIAADDLQRVSEPFFTTKRHGNGLGLSICRSIVWTMGGAMNIESVPGEGTSILVHLPFAELET